jgi:hypothetical protein
VSFLRRLEAEMARLWNRDGRQDGPWFALVHPGEAVVPIDAETAATIKNLRTHFGDVVVIEHRYVASGDIYLAHKIAQPHA